jgi:3-hydroxybutyryl-CoA dehydrogenase
MGADIALAFARLGWRCEVVESDESRLSQVGKYWTKELKRLSFKKNQRRLRLHATMDTVPWESVDLLIEAVTENLALKHRLLRAIEPKLRRGACIATNTSGLRIQDVTRVLKHPERSAGMHFMVPAHVMLAVEVTKGPKTSRATLNRFIAWVTELGKVPVVLRRDVPGMLINRIQHAMYREIYHLMDRGIVKAEDVDRAVRFGFGFRYNILGPVVSRDIHGLPVHLATAKNLYPTLHNGRKAPRVLERLVKAGHHGVRTGRGFYKWDRKTVDRRMRRFTEMLESSLRRVRRVGEPAEF